MSTELVPQGMAVDPFDRLVQQADILARSSIIPKQYRGKPHDIIAAGMLGSDFGWSPTTAMRLVHVVEGKPTVSAEGMVALARARGHSISGEVSSTAATVVGVRADNGDTMTASFTIQDAERAGLAGRGPWRQHTSSMLWARAVSHLCRRLFPDVTLGLYSEGELDSPPPLPDARPAAVEVVDSDTGEVLSLRQPANEATISDEKAASLVEAFGEVAPDFQDKISEWLCSYGDEGDCWSVTVDDLVQLPEGIGEKLAGLIEKAAVTEREEFADDQIVSMRMAVVDMLHELDEAQAGAFAEYREAHELPQRIDERTAAEHLPKLHAWLCAESGAEPFDINVKHAKDEAALIAHGSD